MTGNSACLHGEEALSSAVLGPEAVVKMLLFCPPSLQRHLLHSAYQSAG